MSELFEGVVRARRRVDADRPGPAIPLVLLALGGLGALMVAVIVAVGWYAPGDLLIRGKVPLLAIAVGIIVWAVRERRVGLWIVAAVVAVVTLAANLYSVENLLFRLGMPVFGAADEVAILGVVAVALFVAAWLFGLWHWQGGQTLRVGSEP